MTAPLDRSATSPNIPLERMRLLLTVAAAVNRSLDPQEVAEAALWNLGEACIRAACFAIWAFMLLTSKEGRAMIDLEEKFHQAMLDSYESVKRECQYNSTYFLRMVVDHGGPETAHRVLATNKPSDGFTALWMCRRLDLSVEALALKPEFASLFGDAERRIARSRLAEYGYKLSSLPKAL